MPEHFPKKTDYAVLVSFRFLMCLFIEDDHSGGEGCPISLQNNAGIFDNRASGMIFFILKMGQCMYNFMNKMKRFVSKVVVLSLLSNVRYMNHQNRPD